MATTKKSLSVAKKAPVAAMTAKKKDHGTLSGLPKSYPYVTIGTHLTVTEYEDGRIELTWDDEALLNDVRKAIESVK